eukprot:3530730-Karenia_brevis.AAC.1
MILEKIDTSKPEWLPLDLRAHNEDACRGERKIARGSSGFGSTGVSETIPGALWPAETNKAASTLLNKFADLPSMQ